MLFVLTGPESTAKSALSLALSEHFAVPRIAEVARDYLSSTDYRPSDLLAIAQLQREAEAQAYKPAHATAPAAFADTDLQVLYIWWQERFGPVPADLARAYARQGQRYYLLCEPDIAWSHDPLRENPDDRDRLFALYENDLEHRQLSFGRIRGTGSQRLECAMNVVTQVLDSTN